MKRTATDHGDAKPAISRWAGVLREVGCGCGIDQLAAGALPERAHGDAIPPGPRKLACLGADSRKLSVRSSGFAPGSPRFRRHVGSEAMRGQERSAFDARPPPGQDVARGWLRAHRRSPTFDNRGLSYCLNLDAMNDSGYRLIADRSLSVNATDAIGVPMAFRKRSSRMVPRSFTAAGGASPPEMATSSPAGRTKSSKSLARPTNRGP